MKLERSNELSALLDWPRKEKLLRFHYLSSLLRTFQVHGKIARIFQTQIVTLLQITNCDGIHICWQISANFLLETFKEDFFATLSGQKYFTDHCVGI